MGSSGLITVELKPHNMKSVLSFLCLSLCVALIQGQATDAPKPEWDERGCPALENPLPCWPSRPAASTRTEPTSTRQSVPGPGGTAERLVCPPPSVNTGPSDTPRGSVTY